MTNELALAVSGHVEWVEFARVDRLPHAGEVCHAEALLSEPAGGGAVAAVQLARLAGRAALFTALGEDALGELSRERLKALAVDVHSEHPGGPTRRALTLVDHDGERTIITLGPRLEPTVASVAELAPCDGLYFTAGDAGALRLARERARVLVASPRGRAALTTAGVHVDALVYSAADRFETEAAREIGAVADLTVATDGAAGGKWRDSDGRSGSWHAAALPGAERDTYGAGDTFAAGVTYGLAAGLAIGDALELAARCSATCLTGEGPYERMLDAADL